AVRRDPLADVNPDAGDLARRPLEPDPRKPLDARRLDAEWLQRADERLLEIAAVALHVLPVAREVENRVADELAGRVVGGLSTAVRLNDLDVRVGGDVQLAVVRPPPDRKSTRL